MLFLFLIVAPIIFSFGVMYYDRIKVFFKKVGIKKSTILVKYLVKKTDLYKKIKIDHDNSISDKLDKLNIKDVEAHLRYFKSDINTTKTLSYFKISEIESYLRNKKLKKLKK